ncbi:MAG: ABC transporter substrate-binding protein [Planctomycetota bacterium]
MLLLPLLPLLLTASMAAQEPESTQVAKFVLHTEPRGFDPVHTTQTVDAILQRQVYECLTEYDYAALTDQVVGLLAESWEVSGDGLTWTFTLREDAFFHDPFDPPLWPERRRKLVAQDVLYSWLRMADARDPSLGHWAMEGVFVGLEDFRASTAVLDPEKAEANFRKGLQDGIEGIRVLDAHRLQVQLMYPDPHFTNRLAMSHFIVYPREAVETEGRRLLDQPVGSAPFVVKEWVPGQTAILGRTPGWRGQASPFGDGTLPFLDTVELHTVRDPHTSLEMFDRGEIERMSLGATAIGHFLDEEFELGEEFHERGMVLHEYALPDVTMVCFGMRDAVVGNKVGDEEGNAKRRKLRQALALTFPGKEWAKSVRGPMPAEPARTFLPPVIAGSETMPASDWNHRDIARAKVLLAEAGYPGGEGLPPLEFLVAGTGSLSRSIGDLYRAAAAEIGVELVPVLLPYQEQLQRIRSGQGAVFLSAWVLDWPNASLILQTFYGPFAGTETNLSSFRDPAYDELFRKLRSSENGPKLQEYTRQLLGILDREVPAFPIDHRRSWQLTQPWLLNFQVHPFDILPTKFYRLAEH